jgi:hypothetical protein
MGNLETRTLYLVLSLPLNCSNGCQLRRKGWQTCKHGVQLLGSFLLRWRGCFSLLALDAQLLGKLPLECSLCLKGFLAGGLNIIVMVNLVSKVDAAAARYELVAILQPACPQASCLHQAQILNAA